MADDLNLELAHAVAEARRMKVLTRFEARKLMLPALGLEDQSEATREFLAALRDAAGAKYEISTQGLNPQAEPIQRLIAAVDTLWKWGHRLGLVDEPVMGTTQMAAGYGGRIADTSETDNF